MARRAQREAAVIHAAPGVQPPHLPAVAARRVENQKDCLRNDWDHEERGQPHHRVDSDVPRAPIHGGRLPAGGDLLPAWALAVAVGLALSMSVDFCLIVMIESTMRARCRGYVLTLPEIGCGRWAGIRPLTRCAGFLLAHGACAQTRPAVMRTCWMPRVL